MKKLCSVICTLLLVAIVTGCAAGLPSLPLNGKVTYTGEYRTENGKTTGSLSAVSERKGSASFATTDGHVELTNFDFDTSYDVSAEILDRGLVHTKALLHDGQNISFVIMDGNYPEPFTRESSKRQFNNLYQKLLNANDSPFTQRVDEMEGAFCDGDLLTGIVRLSDGAATICVKLDSYEYVLIGYIGADPDTFSYLADQITKGLTGEVAPIEEPKEEVKEEETPKEEEPEDKGQMYVLKIDGKTIGLDNFGSSRVSQTSEELVTVYPEDGTVVYYKDSYITVGDEKKLLDEAAAIEKVYKVKPELEKLTIGDREDYILTWSDGEQMRSEYFQSLKDVSTYLRTDVKTTRMDKDIVAITQQYVMDF